MNTLLLAVVGSHAYGMAREGSDVDKLGVYAAPTVEFHGLHPPLGKRATIHTTGPDVTLHEAGKFAALCLNANPTVMELLWLPAELHEVKTQLGKQAIALRKSFLSAPRVRNAYLGYATQQFKRLINEGRFPDVPVARIEKHARHLLRLVEQGTRLWVTGELEVQVHNPQRMFDFGARVAEDPAAAGSILARAELTFANCETVLPSAPDEKAVESWLLDVRAEFYGEDRRG